MRSNCGRTREDAFPGQRCAGHQHKGEHPMSLEPRLGAQTHRFLALCSTALIATGRILSSTRVLSARFGSQSKSAT